MKMSRGLIILFIYLFIYLFCLSLFETTEICLGSTRMDNFTRKNHISCWDKIRKPDFASSEKYYSYATAQIFRFNYR